MKRLPNTLPSRRSRAHAASWKTSATCRKIRPTSRRCRRRLFGLTVVAGSDAGNSGAELDADGAREIKYAEEGGAEDRTRETASGEAGRAETGCTEGGCAEGRHAKDGCAEARRAEGGRPETGGSEERQVGI